MTGTTIESIFRNEYGKVLAAVLRTTGDFTLAEDAVSEALVRAVRRWPEDGLPANPAAWLTTVARRAAIDGHRRRQTAVAKQPQLQQDALVQTADDQFGDAPIPDDRLRLIFTCCHPALAPETQIALTLQAVGGLPAEEIARLLLVAPATLSQRLVRAKRKIKASGIAYEIPPPRRWAERLDSVLAVVYLLFTEGYTATRGDDLTRPALTEEALYLGRLLIQLIPDEPEALALLALMYLHYSRRDARIGHDGRLILLREQQRARWDQDAIRAGLDLLERALDLEGAPGRYQLEAAIAAIHAQAASVETTDWSQINGLYAKLSELDPSPIVELNHAVAIAMEAGPAAGLNHLDSVHTQLKGHHRLEAVRGELLAWAGQTEDARTALDRAIALARNHTEVRHLRQRREQL